MEKKEGGSYIRSFPETFLPIPRKWVHGRWNSQGPRCQQGSRSAVLPTSACQLAFLEDSSGLILPRELPCVLSWLKAMRPGRRKGRHTFIAEEPHNHTGSFLPTSKTPPSASSPQPFYKHCPSLGRNASLGFVVHRHCLWGCLWWEVFMNLQSSTPLSPPAPRPRPHTSPGQSREGLFFLELTSADSSDRKYQ